MSVARASAACRARCSERMRNSSSCILKSFSALRRRGDCVGGLSRVVARDVPTTVAGFIAQSGAVGPVEGPTAAPALATYAYDGTALVCWMHWYMCGVQRVWRAEKATGASLRRVRLFVCCHASSTAAALR